MFEKAMELRNETGCPLKACKDALIYSNGDKDLAIAYLKAKYLAVHFSGSFDEKVQGFLRSDNNAE